LRNDHAIAVLGVPDVGVLKPIHVRVEAVGVDVHVGNEEKCDEPPISPSVEYSPD